MQYRRHDLMHKWKQLTASQYKMSSILCKDSSKCNSNINNDDDDNNNIKNNDDSDDNSNK